MWVFKIFHLKEQGKLYKAIKLTKKMGGLYSYRNGITCLMFDIIMDSRKMKSRFSYHHDGNPEIFLQYLSKWLGAWYTACQEEHYIWGGLSFCPNLDIHKIDKEEVLKIENYTKLKKFLQEFFKDTY